VNPHPSMYELIGLIEHNPPFNLLPQGIHGSSHARRVLLFSQLIAAMLSNQPGIAAPDHRILLIATLLHDCGRRNDGIDPYHADRSAEMAVAFCTRHQIECNRQHLQDCIRYHCKSGRFQWADPSIEARILADADKLDRFRFLHQPSPLDPSLLELHCSHELIALAADINGHRLGH